MIFVDTTYIYPFGGCRVAIPLDSVVTSSIDINNDGQLDFTITGTSRYEHKSNSGPCVNFNTSIVISGITGSKVMVSDENPGYAKLLGNNEIVDFSANWSSSGNLK